LVEPRVDADERADDPPSNIAPSMKSRLDVSIANFTPIAVTNRPTPRTTFSRNRSGKRSPTTIPTRPPMSTVAALRRVPVRTPTRVRSMRSR
jgi:hypothetical protein